MEVNKVLKELLLGIKMTAKLCKESEEHIMLELRGYLAGRIAGEIVNRKKKK